MVSIQNDRLIGKTARLIQTRFDFDQSKQCHSLRTQIADPDPLVVCLGNGTVSPQESQTFCPTHQCALF